MSRPLASGNSQREVAGDGVKKKTWQVNLIYSLPFFNCTTHKFDEATEAREIRNVIFRGVENGSEQAGVEE